jgi:hypothetical protein
MHAESILEVLKRQYQTLITSLVPICSARQSVFLPKRNSYGLNFYYKKIQILARRMCTII